MNIPRIYKYVCMYMFSVRCYLLDKVEHGLVEEDGEMAAVSGTLVRSVIAGHRRRVVPVAHVAQVVRLTHCNTRHEEHTSPR